MESQAFRKLCLAASTAAMVLAACAAPATEENQLIADVIEQEDIRPATQAEIDAIQDTDPITRAAFWGDQHELNPRDRDTALNFAVALREISSFDRAAEVAGQALALFPEDEELSVILAKTAMDQGRPDVASSILFAVVNKNGRDWKLRSLYGVSLDQLGEHDLAQAQYQEAMALAPQNTSIIGNMGLSLALQGKANEAEQLLREVVDASPEIDPRVRQNLALVLGLQGKFDEARLLASKDLPPTAVTANSDYYRRLLTPSRNWGDLRKAPTSDGLRR